MIESSQVVVRDDHYSLLHFQGLIRISNLVSEAVRS